MGRVTLQTIADKVGVSRMTVSNAFSKPNELSATLRERIMSVADELGYVGPHPTARALASGSAGAVGLLLTDSISHAVTDEVAMSFLGAIADELAPSGLALTLLSATPRGSVVPARDVAIDGALVYSCIPESGALDWLMRRRLPLVFVDQQPAPRIPSINVDDRGGAEAAAAHIVGLGHRKVAIVTSGSGGRSGIVYDDPIAASGVYVERQRLHGWLDALSAAGIRPTIVRPPYGSPDDVGYSAAGTLLAVKNRPTAILCFSDALAYGVVRAVQDAGLRVPDDVSVVGFDDNPLATRIHPALTTVRQDIDAKGRAAATALLQAVERSKHDAESGRSRHLVLPTSLVVRASTAAPNRKARGE